MEKSGEKAACDFCWNALLARQDNNKLQGEFTEQIHEYHAVIRMVFCEHTSRMAFADIFQRKVVSITLFYFESLQAFAFSI